MELREVMGNRRSIRFLLPHKPVEPEKIQRMLEAARIASHWGNVQSLRAVVVFRDSASEEVIDALMAPDTGCSASGTDSKAVAPSRQITRSSSKSPAWAACSPCWNSVPMPVCPGCPQRRSQPVSGQEGRHGESRIYRG